MSLFAYHQRERYSSSFWTNELHSFIHCCLATILLLTPPFFLLLRLHSAQSETVIAYLSHTKRKAGEEAHNVLNGINRLASLGDRSRREGRDDLWKSKMADTILPEACQDRLSRTRTECRELLPTDGWSRRGHT